MLGAELGDSPLQFLCCARREVNPKAWGVCAQWDRTLGPISVPIKGIVAVGCGRVISERMLLSSERIRFVSPEPATAREWGNARKLK